MIDGLVSIIAQLERQKSSIDRALEALREVESATQPIAAERAAVKVPVKATLDRRAEGQRRRWALKKAAEATPEAITEETSTRSRVTPEGRQKLADAMKRRWAAKRAVAKKTARKKRVPKAVI